MAIINDKNGIKSKIRSIIGNNEDDEKQKIRNKINSILNTSKGVDMTENKEKKSSLGSDFIGLVSNATRSVVNLGTNAFQNLGRRTEQTFEDREKMGQELNEEITKKRLEKQGYTEAQIQEYIDNIPTLKDYASKHNTLNKISETVNNVLSPLSKTNLQKIENTNNQKIQENITNASNPVSKKILELTPSVAQSAVNLIPGGSLVFASGITQSYYEEAKEQRGMTDEEADKYASIMAGLETVSEMIGASLAKKVGSALFKGNVKSAFKNIGLEIGENFLEEAVMEPMGELTTTVVAGKEKANWDNIGERTLKAGIDGALASILLGGASAGVGSAGNLINKLSEGKTVTQNELKGTLEDVQKSQKVEVEAIFKNEMKKALELEKGAFYTIKLDANGQVQGVEQTLGKEIDNPNKRVNISPVVIYNQANESYNIIDKNTGILFDATPYESLIAAKIGFNKKMANLYSNTINSVNKKIEKVNVELKESVEGLKAYAESVLSADKYAEQRSSQAKRTIGDEKNNTDIRSMKFNHENNQSTNIKTSEETLDDITNKYKASTDVLNVVENKDTISLNNIIVKKELRNQGIGTRFINELIQYADAKQKTITLTPTSEYGTKKQLTNFYKKFGFVANKGKNTDFVISDTMYRKPIDKTQSRDEEIDTEIKSMKNDKQQIIDKVKYNPDGKEIKDTHYVEFLADRYIDKKNISGVETDTQETEKLLQDTYQQAKKGTDNEKTILNKQKELIVNDMYKQIKEKQFQIAKQLLNEKGQKENRNLDLEITKKGLKESLHKSISQEKIAVMPYIDILIKTSENGIIRNETKQRSNVNEWYYIYNTALINDKLYGVKIDIRKTPQGDRFYVHRVNLINKEGFSNQIPSNGSATIKIKNPSSIDNSISQKSDSVKGTTVNNKDMQKKQNDVKKKVEKYLKEIESDMTVDGFISKFKDMEITNAENLSADKKKLYDLITEVKQNYGDMLRENQEKYNYKEQEEANQQTDNKGGKLTKEQQEFFKDSKVRDKSGKLLVVYHGTEANKGIPKEYWFTVFDNDKAGNNGSWFGVGHYFSDNKKSVEDNYAHNNGNVYEVYLDIKKPYEPTADKVLEDGTVEFAPGFREDFMNRFNIKNTDFKLNDYLSMKRLTEILKQNGYDGVHVGDTWVAFNSNQIKSIENLSPTSDKDILKEDEEAYKYVQNELKANKKDKGIKIENGKVIYRKFKQDFMDKGYTDLNNTKIEGREDLADIAQIFRNPKYETFRIIYMKGNTIVGHEAISSKIPNASTMLKTDKHGKTHNAKEYYKINDRMKRLEADGYYMVHNHPTGNAKASKNDIASTNIFRKNVNGFKGHLILNSGTYAWISEKYVENELKINDYKQDKIDKMMNANPIIDNIQLNDVIEITHLIDHIKNTDNYSILIYADSKLKTRMIQEVHNSFFNMQDKQTIGYLRNQARKNGASKVFFATSNKETYNKSEKLTRADVLMDSVLYKWNSLNGFNVPIIESMRSNRKIEYKGDGLFEKVEGMRTNETFDEVYEMVQNTTRKKKQNDTSARQAKKDSNQDEGKTNAERASAYIEQEIQKLEKTGKWDETIPVIRLTDIRKTIEDYLGIGIKKGRFRQRAYGIYKTNRDIIRTKEYKDIDTILHETGHALDIGKRIKINKWDIADELLRAISKYGGYETESRKVKLEEGFAEVIREYGIIPEQTKKEYPQTVAIIEEIRKADKSFDKFIGTVQQQIYNYIHQTPANRVHSNQSIGEQTDKQPLTKEWIKQEVMRNVWDKDYEIKALVDELAKAGGKTTNQIKASQNAYLLTRLSNGVAQKSTSMLANGYIDESGNKLMPGLNQIGEILKNDSKRFNDLRDYLVAQRDLEYKAKTLKTGIRTMDSKTVVEQFKNDKEIQEAAKIVYDTLNGVLQYAVNNHLIRQEEAERLRKSNTFYVPMQRVIEGQGNQVGRRGAVTEIIKKRTGSELDVKDVLENIIANSTNIIQQVENNNALKALYKQGEAIGKTGGIYDVISAPMIKVGTAKLSTWEKELQEQGVNTNELDLEKTINIFVPNNKIDTKNLITSFVNDNGKRVYLQFYDEIIFNSMMGMDKQFMSQVLKINRMANMPLRYGATMANVGFAIPNMISDTVQATIYSTAGFIPLIDNALGVIEILAANNKVAKQFLNKYVPNYVKKVNELYTIYQQTGAQSATRLSQYRKSAQEVMRDVYGTKQSENLGVKENIKPLKRLLDILTYIPELSEQSTRFKVFEKNYKYYKKKGYSEKDARLMAAVESRDATQDFSRTGNITKEINQIIPFSAARVGSAYTFSEKVKANPKQIAMRTSILIVLAMAIKAIGYNDKEIEELNQRKKDDNFVLKIGDAVVTIKKPQGVLRSMINLAEYIQDLFTGHIDEGKEGERLGEWISSAIMDNMPTDEITGWVPNAVAPLIENAINKDFYYNTEIVKSYDLDLPDEQQYYDYNSQLAIWLGDVFNYPPAKIDNLISGYFGGLGTGLTDKMDWMIGKLGLTAEKPEMGAEDSMIGKRFVVNVNSHSASIDEIYNRRTELNKKKNGGTITDAETAELETITSAISNLSKLNKQIREIKADTSLSGEEKAKQIKVLQQEKTDTARKALDKELIYEENEQKIESTQFYPTNTELKNSGYVLTLTSKMKKEYEEYANNEYNRLKKQGLYTEEKMIESAKKKAKAYMFSTYKNKLVKAET